MRKAINQNALTWLAVMMAAVLFAPSQRALAGALSVLPVRVEVAAGKQFCSLRIGNDGGEDVTVQVRGLGWYQGEDGRDRLDETQRIAINPAIVTIPAGTRKLVRCSLPATGGPREDTYRLIVSELPDGQEEPGTLQTLLQLSIPVFRSEPDASPALHWSADAAGRLILSNTGSRHARIAQLRVRGAGNEPITAAGGFYLLAGARRIIAPAMPAGAVTEVEAITEDGTALLVPSQNVSTS